MKLRLSVLDQTPIRKNSDATASLQESVELARLADKAGYTRYWLSEHHNSITLAGASPEILLARLGAETSRIRLGSGGIMLPNHSTLKVAENFRLLEALYPNRIDLGIGRAPGTDRATAHLLNPSNTFDPQEYIQQIRELHHYFSETPSVENMQGKIKAIPSISTAPDMWILTSSGESAAIAAHFGIGLAFAKFINPYGGAEAIRAYKQSFRASDALTTPATSVAIFAFCSEDKELANQAAAVMGHRLLGFERGEFNKSFSFDDIKDYTYSLQEQQRLEYHRQRFITGTPDECSKQFIQLARDFDTEEIIVATFSDKREDRLASYELLAKKVMNTTF